MRRTCLSIALFALCMSAGTINAVEGDSTAIRLICKYSYTMNEKGEKSGTSGEVLFTVLPRKDGQVTVRKQGLGSPFLGRMSEEEFVADVSYQIGNVKLAESLVINRFTGEFRLSFGALGKDGLIHFGSCRSATKQRF